MSALAMLAKENGIWVSGEDQANSTTVNKLREKGVLISDRHSELAKNCDALIYSAAIPASHPAFGEAKRRGIPILSRSDYLGAMMEPYKKRITVAGIHGKSTVTAMIDHILTHAGLSPTTVSGASLCSGENYRIGGGDVFLAEACEYTDSFLSLSPTIAVALNLEHDHPDYFKDELAIFDSFRRYLEKAEEGMVLPKVGPLFALAKKDLPTKTFGDGGDLSGRITREGECDTTFTIFEKQNAVGELTLPLPGRYQVDNALAAILTARMLGVSYSISCRALADFISPERRCRLRKVINGVRFYDDYAHHPSEIKAVLTTLRRGCRGSLVCAFEAHTYSRLAAFFKGYLEALTLADRVVILPIYPARESDTLGQSETGLADALKVPSKVCRDLASAAAYLKESTAAGDTVAVLGAGNTPMLFDCLEN